MCEIEDNNKLIRTYLGVFIFTQNVAVFLQRIYWLKIQIIFLYY